MNRKIKKKVLDLLAEGDLVKSRKELAEYDEHGLVNPLFSALYRSEERLRWHTVTLFGEVLARLADKDMEAARVVMRRFLWSLNDESGGIGWGAPEAMAEAMCQHDGLCEEYLHMLISYMLPDGPLDHQDGNFLELPALQRGLLWGICRLAEKRRELMIKKDIVTDLLPYLESTDANVRGLAARAIALLDGAEWRNTLQAFLADEQKIRFYRDGEIVLLPVSELVGAAMQGEE